VRLALSGPGDPDDKIATELRAKARRIRTIAIAASVIGTAVVWFL